MYDRIRRLLTAPEEPAMDRDDLQAAVAVLLLKAARTDGIFDHHERATIEHLLQRKFQLSQATVKQLLWEAEETIKRPHELPPFARVAVEHMEPQRLVHLIEMLWEVAFADDKLDPGEETLLHRVAGLTGVGDSECESAKHRVLRWLQQKHNR